MSLDKFKLHGNEEIMQIAFRRSAEKNAAHHNGSGHTARY